MGNNKNLLSLTLTKIAKDKIEVLAMKTNIKGIPNWMK